MLQRKIRKEAVKMAQLFEAIMVICFGISWPISIRKSLLSKTAKGKSLLFIFFIFAGYAFGIISKLLADQITYVLVFYVLNLIMVSIDIVLYFRNLKYDKQVEQEHKTQNQKTQKQTEIASEPA
jgi:hypothetical protein